MTQADFPASLSYISFVTAFSSDLDRCMRVCTFHLSYFPEILCQTAEGILEENKRPKPQLFLDSRLKERYLGDAQGS